jgi:hypothetical protein
LHEPGADRLGEHLGCEGRADIAQRLVSQGWCTARW